MQPAMARANVHRAGAAVFGDPERNAAVLVVVSVGYVAVDRKVNSELDQLHRARHECQNEKNGDHARPHTGWSLAKCRLRVNVDWGVDGAPGSRAQHELEWRVHGHVASFHARRCADTASGSCS